MELIFALLSELGNFAYFAMFLICGFLLFSGSMFLFRGYWVYKRRIKIAGAITYALFTFLFILWVLVGFDALELARDSAQYKALVRESGFYLLVLSLIFCPIAAYLGYKVSYHTFRCSVCVFGGLAGFLMGGWLTFGGSYGFFSYDIANVILMGLIGAALFAWMISSAVETFVIIMTCFIGAGIIANVTAFLAMGFSSSLDDLIRIYQSMLSFSGEIRDLYKNISDIDNLQEVKDFLQYALASFAFLDEDLVWDFVYYQLVSIVLMFVFFLVGVHVQFSHFQQLDREEIQRLSTELGQLKTTA